MRAIRFLAGLAVAPALALSQAAAAGPDAAAEARALPALEREALLRCLADERESRVLLEQHGQDSEAVAISGHALDAEQRELAALRATIDPRDAAAVDRYNASAAGFDARVRRHNARLAALEAGIEAQRAVARRYNANCGGRHFQPDALRPRGAPAPQGR